LVIAKGNLEKANVVIGHDRDKERESQRWTDRKSLAGGRAGLGSAAA